MGEKCERCIANFGNAAFFFGRLREALDRLEREKKILEREDFDSLYSYVDLIKKSANELVELGSISKDDVEEANKKLDKFMEEIKQRVEKGWRLLFGDAYFLSDMYTFPAEMLIVVKGGKSIAEFCQKENPKMKNLLESTGEI